MNKPTVRLIGEDGNVYNIFMRCSEAARKAGWTQEQVDAMIKDFMASDSYDEVLRKVMTIFEVE